MYSYGSPHMAAQKQDDQLERTFSSYVRIQAVVLKTYLGRWTIGRSGERGSGISVLPARYDDDDDIYSHPQTDCFVLSELFSVARHSGRSKPGSKPVQLYVRLSFRSFGHQADHVGYGNFKVFILATAAAAFVYIFLYPIGYQSAQFFRRALHYARCVCVSMYVCVRARVSVCIEKNKLKKIYLVWIIIFIITGSCFELIFCLHTSIFFYLNLLIV